jgi:hypothetical protein
VGKYYKYENFGIFVKSNYGHIITRDELHVFFFRREQLVLASTGHEKHSEVAKSKSKLVNRHRKNYNQPFYNI